MIRRKDGFSLVELMITMTIFVFALAAATSVFTGLLTQFKQQGKIAETAVEGVVGMEIMRQDLENAGVGLPWTLPAGATYQETGSAPNSFMNDGPPGNPARTGDHGVTSDAAGASNGPAPIRSYPNQMLNLSDILAVKSVVVSNKKTSGGWTLLPCSKTKKTGLSGYSFAASDTVITLTVNRQLVMNGVQWYTSYSATDNFAPPKVGAACDPNDYNIVYGVDPYSATLRMPFNRADYYVKVPANLPVQCAPGTGVLYKAVTAQTDGTLINSELPLLDCVATMKVVFELDTENTGNLTSSTDIKDKTAQNIRSQLREVRVSILAQDGQKDPSYSYPNPTVTLGADTGTGYVGYSFDMTAIPNYKNYRWKQYNLIVKTNLSGS